MKFGKQLVKEADSYPRYKNYYINYKELKRAIKIIAAARGASTSGASSGPGILGQGSGEALFQESLVRELEKIDRFVDLQLDALVGELRRALRVCRKADVTEEQLDAVESNVDDLANEIVALQTFVRMNFTGFRKITKKYDKRNRSQVQGSSIFMARVVHASFMSVDFDRILLLLDAVRREWRESARRLEHLKRTPPQSDTQSLRTSDVFGIMSHASNQAFGSFGEEKRHAVYLVKLEMAMQLKTVILKYCRAAAASADLAQTQSDAMQLVATAKHGEEQLFPVPRQPMGAFRRRASTPFGAALSGIAARCTCVYFDNKNLEEYRDHLRKKRNGELDGSGPSGSEGGTGGSKAGTSFRCRWFGDNMGEPTKEIRIELDGRSVSDRDKTAASGSIPVGSGGGAAVVTMQQKDMRPFIEGKLDIDKWKPAPGPHRADAVAQL